MYDILKNVIGRKEYDLNSIIKKIDFLWSEDKLTDEQRAELSDLARNGAETQNSVDVIKKLAELEERIKALESNNDIESDVSEFVPDKWYYNGDKCSFDGVDYVCIAPAGAVCVWSPSDYPQYWEEI